MQKSKKKKKEKNEHKLMSSFLKKGGHYVR